MKFFLTIFILIFFLTDSFGMEGSSSSNKPTKTRFGKMPSFKNLSRQISNLSSASSTNPIDDALEKVGKKIKNWMLKSKEKVKEVGRDVSEVVHRGEHKYKYDEISENLQKYAKSGGILNSVYSQLVETKNELENKYGKDLKTVKDSAHDFYEFVRSIEMIVAKPKNFRNKIIGQIKAHFLKDNEKVEEKYIGVIKQMMNDYNSYDDEKDKKIPEGREEYNEKLKVFKEKYAIWNKIYKKFDKDEVEISKEILRLNEEEEKYNKAYDAARNLIETKTLAGSSHKRSRRRGSREFSIGSSEEIRSNLSGEVSLYSHNSNESGHSDRSTSSASRILKSAGKKAKKVKESTALFAKGIPGNKIGKNLNICKNTIAPIWIEINKEIDEINKLITDIEKSNSTIEDLLHKHEGPHPYDQFDTVGADIIEFNKLQHAVNQLVDKETIIYLIGLYDMRKWKGYQIGEFYQKSKMTALASLQDFNEEKQTLESVQELLTERGFVYNCSENPYRDPQQYDHTFYNEFLNMYYHPRKKINQDVDAVIEPENYHRMLGRFEIQNAEHGGGHDSEQQYEIEYNSEHEQQYEIEHYSEHETEIASHDDHDAEPSPTHGKHYEDPENYDQIHSGLNTMSLNQPSNPSSSRGPWNQQFDQNEQTHFNWDQWFQQNPSHGRWPNHLGYGYHNQQSILSQQNPSGQPWHPSSSQFPWNQPFDNEHYPSSHVHWATPSGYDPYNPHNTSIQQNPSGTWDWINNPSSSTTHVGHFGGPQNFHLIQTGQSQDIAVGYPLHHPLNPPFRHPHDLHQIQSDQSQNTMSGDYLNDPPVDQQNPGDWNRF